MKTKASMFGTINRRAWKRKTVTRRRYDFRFMRLRKTEWKHRGTDIPIPIGLSVADEAAYHSFNLMQHPFTGWVNMERKQKWDESAAKRFPNRSHLIVGAVA